MVFLFIHSGTLGSPNRLLRAFSGLVRITPVQSKQTSFKAVDNLSGGKYQITARYVFVWSDSAVEFWQDWNILLHKVQNPHVTSLCLGFIQPSPFFCNTLLFCVLVDSIRHRPVHQTTTP